MGDKHTLTSLIKEMNIWNEYVSCPDHFELYLNLDSISDVNMIRNLTTSIPHSHGTKTYYLILRGGEHVSPLTGTPCIDVRKQILVRHLVHGPESDDLPCVEKQGLRA